MPKFDREITVNLWKFMTILNLAYLWDFFDNDDGYLEDVSILVWVYSFLMSDEPPSNSAEVWK